MNWKRTISTALLCGPVCLPAFAGGITLSPVQDNTLYEVVAVEGNGSPFLSNGAGIYFFSGATAQGDLRRGLLAFDIAGSLPTGAIITAVSLTLEMSQTIAGPESVELHRVSSDWGEGDSDAPGPEGSGAPAAPGDATWIHTFYDTGFWSAAGGDFSTAVSATQSVDDDGSYTWGPTPEMVTDVQSWLDDPAANYGWLVMGNETSSATAKRFNTRENGSGAPQLVITFQTPVPTVPWPGLLLLTILLATAALLVRTLASRED